MIGNHYQITDIFKQSKNKSVYRVQQVSESHKTQKSQYYVIKQYATLQKKYFNKELMMYNVVLKDMFLKGFPQIKDLGNLKDFSYIVLSQLGQNLQDLKKKVGGRFTLKTVLMIALQILDRIEDLHSKGYIHGDIQPSNFLIGSGKFSHKLFLVDFEFSFPYILQGKHITEQVIDNFTGSIKFCSLASNSLKNISRKDDLQSLIYCLIYLIKGTLPWQNLKSGTFIQVYEQTAKIKKQNLKELVEGLPEIFLSIIQQIRNLKFDEKPNYEKIKRLFSALMKKNGYDIDYKYDWTYV